MLCKITTSLLRLLIALRTSGSETRGSSENRRQLDIMACRIVDRVGRFAGFIKSCRNLWTCNMGIQGCTRSKYTSTRLSTRSSGSGCDGSHPGPRVSGRFSSTRARLDGRGGSNSLAVVEFLPRLASSPIEARDCPNAATLSWREAFGPPRKGGEGRLAWDPDAPVVLPAPPFAASKCFHNCCQTMLCPKNMFSSLAINRVSVPEVSKLG